MRVFTNTNFLVAKIGFCQDDDCGRIDELLVSTRQIWGNPMLGKIFISAAAAVALGSTAFAADLPARTEPPVYVPPPPPIFTWTGFYIGGQIGYQWGNNSFGN